MLLSNKIERKFIDSVELFDLEIETDSGWQPITHIHKTVPYEKWKMTTSSGLFLESADDHIVFDENMNEIFIKNLVPGVSRIQTADGIQFVSSVERFGVEEEMFDITVDSNDHRFYTNGILSHNTTLQASILFALFGKTEKKINKPQLINSINQKNMLVILTFKVNNDQYVIQRGLKPNIFKITRNGLDLDEESSTKIDQDYLENSILKMNFKTFTQICLLSSANFVAFFGLPLAHKREIIDDILGISVFSEMKMLLKSKIDSLKEDQQMLLSEIRVNIDRIAFLKKSLNEIEFKLNSSLSEKQKQVDSMLKDSNRLSLSISEKQKEYDSIVSDFNKRKSESEVEMKILDDKIKTQMHTVKDIVKKMKFFDSTNICPTCFQDIDESQKKKYTADIKLDILDLNNSLASNKTQYETRRSEFNNILAEQKSIDLRQKDISKIQVELSHLLQHIRIIEKEMNELNTKDNILYTHKLDLVKTLEDTEKQLEKQNAQIAKNKNELIHHHFIGDMLKDDGIKTKVIRYYLPIINSLMEKYLNLFSFFVSFNLDENFNEVIKERHYSQFSYESFSEGEKSRLNLAILFTFRELIKIRNTARVNLLFLDEIFQSSLDESGKAVLMEVLQTLSAKGENIFVITHDKDIMENGEYSFSRVLQFETKNNFSTYSEVMM